MTIRSLAALGACLLSMSLLAQEPSTGPIIDGYGRSVAVPDADFKLPANHDYRVVWEITEFPNGPGAVNRELEFPARFLNLHAKAGVPLAKMHLAVVTHGAALKNFLTDEVYEREFDMKNPNADLVQKLLGAGVQIYVCGQALAFQGRDKAQLAPGVKLAQSALTMMHLLQNQGYTVQP